MDQDMEMQGANTGGLPGQEPRLPDTPLLPPPKSKTQQVTPVSAIPAARGRCACGVRKGLQRHRA